MGKRRVVVGNPVTSQATTVERSAGSKRVTGGNVVCGENRTVCVVRVTSEIPARKQRVA